VNLITKDSPQYFELTSEESYDRHDYRVVMKDGRTFITSDWENAQLIWFQNSSQLISHIEVLDKPDNKNKKSNGGFR
jgi:hypothetical protein